MALLGQFGCSSVLALCFRTSAGHSLGYCRAWSRGARQSGGAAIIYASSAPPNPWLLVCCTHGLMASAATVRQSQRSTRQRRQRRRRRRATVSRRRRPASARRRRRRRVSRRRRRVSRRRPRTPRRRRRGTPTPSRYPPDGVGGPLNGPSRDVDRSVGNSCPGLHFDTFIILSVQGAPSAPQSGRCPPGVPISDPAKPS